VIFGVAVVFPVVINFGVAGVLAGYHAQAAVQGFFPWLSPSASIRRTSRAGRCAPVNNVPDRGAGTLLVYTNKTKYNYVIQVLTPVHVHHMHKMTKSATLEVFWLDALHGSRTIRTLDHSYHGQFVPSAQKSVSLAVA